MRSGFSRRTASNASSPSCATATSNPSRSKSVRSRSTTLSMSSTTKIFAMADLEGLRFDQPAADGVPHETGGVMEIQLVHNTMPMRFRRFHAHSQQARHFLGRHTLSDQLQHFAFSGRQRVGRYVTFR